MDIDYLEAAKNQILAIEGEHPIEEVKVRSLTAIADVLIHMAMNAERTCHTIPYNSQAEEYADAWKISAVCSECGWTLETKKGDKVRMHDPYCGGCGAKVVE